MPARPPPRSVVFISTSRSRPLRSTVRRTVSPGVRSEMALTMSATCSVRLPSTSSTSSSSARRPSAGRSSAIVATRLTCGTFTPVLRRPTAIEFFCAPCIWAVFISRTSSSVVSAGKTSSSGSTRESPSRCPATHSQTLMCRSGPPSTRTVVKYRAPSVG